MLDFLRTYQLNLMLALSGMCGLVALFVFLTKFSSYKRKLSLLQVELCSMLLLMSERFSYVYRGNVSQLGYWMVRISNFCVFFFEGVFREPPERPVFFFPVCAAKAYSPYCKSESVL